MIRHLLPLVILGLLPGCCCCCGNKSDHCRNPFKPPVNAMGNAYDGGDSPCYRPPGPFWCCLPGPCATCRDPWLQYYQDRHAWWIGRNICTVDGELNDTIGDEDMTSATEGPAPRVIHQAKLED